VKGSRFGDLVIGRFEDQPHQTIDFFNRNRQIAKSPNREIRNQEITKSPNHQIGIPCLN
jgi:hypothetical protein